MALSDDGVYRWRVLMCSDQYIAGDTAWDAPTRLALNEWGYIYIPMSAFISGGNGFDKNVSFRLRSINRKTATRITLKKSALQILNL